MGGIKKIFSYADKYKGKIYLAMGLITFSVLVNIVPYFLIYKIIIEFTLKETPSALNVLFMSGLIFLSLFLKAYTYHKGLGASHEAAYDTLMEMRKKLSTKLLKMPMGEINKRTSGYLKKIFVDSIEEMELILAHIIPEGISCTLGPLVIITALFVLDYRMALLALATLPIGVTAFILMMKDGLKRMPKYYESSNVMNSNIVEYIGGMEVIKIFNQTTTSFKKYSDSVRNFKTFTLDWVEHSWKYMTIYQVVIPCTLLFVLPFGSMFYINGTMTLETFVLSIFLAMGFGVVFVKLVAFGPMIPNLLQKTKGIEEIFNAVELEETNRNIAPADNNVVFENIYFAYEKKDVIKNVSFNLKENTVTALVGPSGSGKSTLAKLLIRFWDVKNGTIKIGDVDIKDISFESLMNRISYVSQDIYLFNTSIMENIRMGKQDASDEEVIRVSRLAQCHDFIMETKNGYETGTGDAGDKLSGGQKQRISIARALLKDSPIIVLDEATAFTDPENEDKIQVALNGLISEKTLLVIAHRLSTIVGADNIILMDEGNISDQGTHGELLIKSALYKNLWDAHIRSVDWDLNVKEVS